MTRYFISTLALLVLSACSGTGKDYGATAHCQGLGLTVGTPEYTDCVREQQTQRLMQQQHEEYERMKQEDRDIKLRQYGY